MTNYQQLKAILPPDGFPESLLNSKPIRSSLNLSVRIINYGKDGWYMPKNKSFFVIFLHMSFFCCTFAAVLRLANDYTIYNEEI